MTAAVNYLLALWVIRVLKPEWILSYFVPSLGFIKGIPTLLLFGLLAYVVFTLRKPLVIDKPYLCFVVVILISTLFAVNTGLARNGLRYVTESFIFFSLCLTLVSSEQAFDKMIAIYVITLFFYAISGIAFNGLVPFHVFLNNEDAFGPFMVLGTSISFYAALQSQKTKFFYVIVAAICVLGLIASFARGAFLSLCALGIFIWWKSGRKFKTALIMCMIILVFMVSANILFEGGKYWQEMATIDDSLSDEKTEGRHFLRRKAIEMFKENPVVGVGPYNYGFVLPRITTQEQAAERGVHVEQLYHRVPHSVYFQILSELGTAGVVCFLAMLYSFWRKNKSAQADRGNWSDAAKTSLYLRKRRYYALALQGAMVVYLVNGMFYDILYYPWFTDLLIMNSLVLRT
ncbi:MAG: O-antigen ligase family protein [Nitrospirota bacterium]